MNNNFNDEGPSNSQFISQEPDYAYIILDALRRLQECSESQEGHTIPEITETVKQQRPLIDDELLRTQIPRVLCNAVSNGRVQEIHKFHSSFLLKGQSTAIPVGGQTLDDCRELSLECSGERFYFKGCTHTPRCRSTFLTHLHDQHLMVESDEECDVVRHVAPASHHLVAPATEKYNTPATPQDKFTRDATTPFALRQGQNSHVVHGTPQGSDPTPPCQTRGGPSQWKQNRSPIYSFMESCAPVHPTTKLVPVSFDNHALVPPPRQVTPPPATDVLPRREPYKTPLPLIKEVPLYWPPNMDAANYPINSSRPPNPEEDRPKHLDNIVSRTNFEPIEIIRTSKGRSREDFCRVQQERQDTGRHYDVTQASGKGRVGQPRQCDPHHADPSCHNNEAFRECSNKEASRTGGSLRSGNMSCTCTKCTRCKCARHPNRNIKKCLHRNETQKPSSEQKPFLRYSCTNPRCPNFKGLECTIM